VATGIRTWFGRLVSSSVPPLLARFPETTYRRLIVWYPEIGAIDLASRFEEAADRLEQSFTGDPPDDQFLIPWLYLQRHVTELTLKAAIEIAAAARREAGDHDSSLDPHRLRKHLQSTLGHKLVPLADELNAQLAQLNIDPIPEDTMALLRDFADLDPDGTSLRYAKGASSRIDRNGFRIDFPALADALKYMNGIIGATIDMIEPW
jgi:hypothetical protein